MARSQSRREAGGNPARLLRVRISYWRWRLNARTADADGGRSRAASRSLPRQPAFARQVMSTQLLRSV